MYKRQGNVGILHEYIAAIGGDKVILKVYLYVEEHRDNVALGYRRIVYEGVAGIGGVLLQGVLVGGGSYLLAHLGFHDAACLFHHLLFAVVALVHGDSKGLIMPYAEFLYGVLQLVGGAVTIGAGAVIVVKVLGYEIRNPDGLDANEGICLLYTSPSPRD